MTYHNDATVYREPETPEGNLRVYANTTFRTSETEYKFRKVLVLSDYSVEAAKAKTQLQNLRELNPEHKLQGRLIIDL